MDTRHRVAANWILDIPIGPGHKVMADGVAGKILGGFNFSGIITGRDRPSVHRDAEREQRWSADERTAQSHWRRQRSANGRRLVRQDRVPGGHLGTFGNSGRNILRGPGLVNVDTALQRRFKLGGSTAFELRWEVFNIFNTNEFGLPDSNISNGTFGRFSALPAIRA